MLRRAEGAACPLCDGQSRLVCGGRRRLLEIQERQRLLGLLAKGDYRRQRGMAKELPVATLDRWTPRGAWWMVRSDRRVPQMDGNVFRRDPRKPLRVRTYAYTGNTHEWG